MPTGVHLSGHQQGLISGFKELGYSARQIEKMVHVSKHAILNYLHDPQTGTRGHLAGRKTATTMRDKRRILRSASNSFMSCTGILAETDVKVSKRTVLRVLSSCPHLKRSKAKKRPPCFRSTKVKRLEFAQTHLQWNQYQNPLLRSWQKTVFSDEKKFNLDGPDGWAYYWHDLRKEKRYLMSRQGGGSGVMVWLGFTIDRKLQLYMWDGKVKATNILNAFENEIEPFFDEMGDETYSFYEDNASVHYAHLTQNWPCREKYPRRKNATIFS